MIINKAILHIFDFISEVCIFSQKEIDLREDNINEFIKKHIKNVLSDSNSKEGTLKINSSFLTKLNEYNYGRYDFCSFSQAIGKELYAQISLSDKKESMDFLFVDFTEDNQDFLGLVFLGYKRAYTHQVMQSDTIVYNTLIQHQAILPSTAQKVDSFAIIQKNSWYVRFVDKRRYIEGRDTYILPDVILQCDFQKSSKEMLKTVTQIVSKVAEGHGVNSAVALSKAKNFLCENAEVSTTLSPTDLCQQIFSDSEEMQDEFLSLVQEEQIPDEIKIEKSFAIKASKSHRIKTDTGIEVIFPAEYFENHEFIEFVNNPNGTISIQLKNIGKIVNK